MKYTAHAYAHQSSGPEGRGQITLKSFTVLQRVCAASTSKKLLRLYLWKFLLYMKDVDWTCLGVGSPLSLGGYKHETTGVQQKQRREKLSSSSQAVSNNVPVTPDGFSQDIADHRTSQAEATNPRHQDVNKFQLHFQHIHSLCKCQAIRLHFPSNNREKKTKLWSRERACSKDNKWPWARLSCYHWFWSLSQWKHTLYFL